MKSGFVAIIGRPNAGKSTLLNEVLRTKLAIVTPKAQTTRERLFGILTEDQKGQIVFVDTPGIHRAKEGGINEYMVSEARGALEAPSVIWYLLDPNSALVHENAVIDLIGKNRSPVFLILNKADLKKGEEVLKEVSAALKERGVRVEQELKISALKGEGLEELLNKTWALMGEGPMYFPDPEQTSDRPVRYFVGEKIREQLLHSLGAEIPYSCAVQIEKFDESSRVPRIDAIIYVERESQKGIVVGKGGSKIKEIGQNSRKEVEDFLGTQVFLGLRVKVLKDWTRDAETLKRMGYQLPKKREVS